MEIFLVRHAHALDEAPGLGDTGRWLSERGRKITRKVGRWMAKGKKRRPAAIWSSPLVRAVQTAEILAAEVGYKGEVKAVGELSPGRDPGDLLLLLQSAGTEGPLVLVGHEPSLSLIAKALLGETSLPPFKKSGVLGLRYEEGKATFRLLLDPMTRKVDRTIGVTAQAEPPPPGPEAPPSSVG
ncbi:MAG: histidine phosphatase family protein [Byssovorax sp.]